MKIDATLSPGEFPAIARRDLRETVCVVFDVLRATSTMVAALSQGAKEIIPVGEIPDALSLKRARPEILLGGERNGVRIRADGIAFDLGNSPREYTREIVAGRTIVSTTTNGTRALRACAGAKLVLAGSFLNLSATAAFLQSHPFDHLLLICAGTRDNPAFEDALGAGALGAMLVGNGDAELTAPMRQALEDYRKALPDWAGTIMRESENANRLLAIPELRDDVAFCLRQDTHPLVAGMNSAGAISILSQSP